MSIVELNESPEPTGAALPVFKGRERFVALWLRRGTRSGAIGSALRSAKPNPVDKSRHVD